MTDSIEKKHASLQCWLSDWIEKEFPALAEQLEGFVVRGNDSCLCLDNVSLRMADAAMSVLLAYVEATGLPEHRPTPSPPPSRPTDLHIDSQFADCEIASSLQKLALLTGACFSAIEDVPSGPGLP